LFPALGFQEVGDGFTNCPFGVFCCLSHPSSSVSGVVKPARGGVPVPPRLAACTVVNDGQFAAKLRRVGAGRLAASESPLVVTSQANLSGH
jgi:hypothetical protein